MKKRTHSHRWAQGTGETRMFWYCGCGCLRKLSTDQPSHFQYQFLYSQDNGQTWTPTPDGNEN